MPASLVDGALELANLIAISGIAMAARRPES